VRVAAPFRLASAARAPHPLPMRRTARTEPLRSLARCAAIAAVATVWAACGADVGPSPWTEDSRTAGFVDAGFDARSVRDAGDTSFLADAAAQVDAMAFAVERSAPVQIGTSDGFRMVTVAQDAQGSVAASPRFVLYVAPGS